MFCENCGAKLADGAKFCESCGTPVANNVADTPVENNSTPEANSTPEEVNTLSGYDQPVGTPVQPSANPTMETPKAPKEPKDNPIKKILADPKKRIIAIASAAVLVIAIGLIIFFATRPSEIDLSDYIKVTFDGYNGHGTATVEFDHDKFEKVCEEKGKNLKVDYKDLDSWDDLLEIGGLYAIESAFEYDLSKDSDLSNGDTIELKCEIDNESIKEYGIELTCSTTSYKVSGLAKVKEVDPFADAEMTIEGVSPELRVTIENNSDDSDIADVRYDYESYTNYAIGDSVTVTIDEYTVDSYLEDKGIAFTQTSKDFKIEEADEYIDTMNGVTDDMLKDFKSKAKDITDTYLDGEDDYIKYSGLKYEGYYFLDKKDEYKEDSYDWNDYNQLYLVYSANIKKSSSCPSYYKFKPQTLYLVVEFDEVIKSTDGTLRVEDIPDGIVYHYADIKNGPYLKGYTKLNDMKKDIVGENKVKYDSETSDNLK